MFDTSETAGRRRLTPLPARSLGYVALRARCRGRGGGGMGREPCDGVLKGRHVPEGKSEIHGGETGTGQRRTEDQGGRV